ncbi:MAG: hypothetical protein Q4E26_05720 [Prevotellaceae bacterium]|nr:hypothetical protein [Prevotellaceae bacterium]MDO4992440.1 hypothetical protein [Prevotellaceae bacterium]
MKKEYSAPIAELFEAELDGMIAVSMPIVDVVIDPDDDDDPTPPDYGNPGYAESHPGGGFDGSRAKGCNPIFDF